MDKEYHHQIHVQNDGYKKMAPATAPKPFSAVATPYKPGVQSYRPVRVDNYHEDNAYPPPPPPDALQYNYSPEDDFPPPPPPAPPTSYSEEDPHIYSNVYSGQAHYMRTDEYRPGPPPAQQRPTDGKIAGPQYADQHSHKPESNYANIQINIAPPTPTNKESGYQSHPEAHTYEAVGPRGGPTSVHSHPIQERPIPGPMVPPSGRDYSSAVGPTSPPARGQNKPEKEAEVDALTDLLLKNMTSPSQQGQGQSADYWGQCGRCNGTVAGESNACTALDNVYHTSCFTCVGCSCALHGKSFFAMEGKPYCENCYVNTLERCSICSKPITDRLLRATGKPYHPDCFTCVVCGKSLDGIPFTVDATNQIHCIEDFHKKFAPRCCMCQRPIMPSPGQEETVRIVAMDKSFHVDCYRCEDCYCQLSSEAEGKGCYPLDDHILCKNCNAKRIQALTTRMSTEL